MRFHRDSTDRTKMNSSLSSGFVILMVALCVCAPVFGQEEENAESTVCDLCVCVTDVTCTAEGNCAGVTGCEFTQFTPSYTGTYVLKSVLSCADCEHCLACAVVTNAAGGVIGSAQAGCVANQCSGGSTVNLTGGITYKLFACLRTCSGNSASCANCTAKAKVYQTEDDCSAPCN